MDSETVPRQIGWGYAHLIYSKWRIPLRQNPKWSDVYHFVKAVHRWFYFYILCLRPCALSIGWKKRVGVVSFPKAKPPFHTFHALPGHVHTSLIRTGVFCRCSGDGSLKRLGLGTAPALFPSSPCHIPSRKHFICGSGKAYVGLASAVWKAAGNRLCNVFGGVVLVFTVSVDLWQAEPPPQ